VKGYYSFLHKMLTAAALALIATPVLAAKLTQYYVPATSSIALKFNALDPARMPIDTQWLLREVAAALEAKSSWPLKTDGESTLELSGLRTRVDWDESRILFEYLHVARNKVGEEWGETLSIPVSYRIERTNDAIVVHLGPAEMADLLTRKTFLPGPKLKPVVELFQDFSTIMRSAPSLALHRAVLLSGEEESSASPQGCIERFDYVLGRYAFTNGEERPFDPKHDDVFLFRTAQESVPLKVAAVNFRGGSKVFFEAWVPFELRADGSVEGYDIAPALKSEVRRVLGDLPAREAERELDAARDGAKSRDRR
jgi:hypothetical protein